MDDRISFLWAGIYFTLAFHSRVSSTGGVSGNVGQAYSLKSLDSKF